MNSVKPTGVINGKMGDNIRKEFTEYYKAVYQPNTPGADNWYKVELDELLDSYTRSDTNTVTPSVNIQIMQSCINSLKPRKAAGHDGVLNELIIHSGNSLAVHICLLFNSFIRHAFVPTAFQKGIIKPVLWL